MTTHIIELLRDERDRQGLTNRDLERMTGIPDSTIQRLLGGHVGDPRFDNVSLLCRALGISIDALVGIENKDSEVIQTLQREKDLLLARVGEAEAKQAILHEQLRCETLTRETMSGLYERDRLWQKRFGVTLALLSAILLAANLVMGLWHMIY